MIRSYELNNNYIPLFIQAIGGIQMVLLIVIIWLLLRQEKRLKQLEAKVERLVR